MGARGGLDFRCFSGFACFAPSRDIEGHLALPRPNLNVGFIGKPVNASERSTFLITARERSAADPLSFTRVTCYVESIPVSGMRMLRYCVRIGGSKEQSFETSRFGNLPIKSR